MSGHHPAEYMTLADMTSSLGSSSARKRETSIPTCKMDNSMDASKRVARKISFDETNIQQKLPAVRKLDFSSRPQ